ncbi:hypothetical protein C8F04DRAFT_1274946 [Mycena alexandri]|uniref:Ribonuclease H1 N-terminal domain-containing protein n=1 Tax=Mycena alexandri TaxID=1745969 RepID=A0AAD6S4S5_9AGAR|nr:hypothetical protein C8F04DRAFT_1274946 [Mycena alexandri]
MAHDDALKDTARSYTDDEFAALLATLSLSTPPLSPEPRTQTPPPREITSSRSVYYFEFPTRRGYTSSWAEAGTATQGIPGAHVRAVIKPSKKRVKKGAYVVFFGRAPGVYLTWEETERLVLGVKNAIFRGYRTVADAHAAYEYALARSWTRVSHLTPTPLATVPPPTIAASEALNPLHGSKVLDDTWYVVYRGILPGVYRSSLEAALNTVGVANALHESVESREEALRRYTQAQQDHNTGISPPPSYTPH